MKNLILVLSICLFSIFGSAFQEKDINLNLGGGLFGTRGLIGLSMDRFFSENHALSFGVGVDFIGATSTVGYKYFTEKTNNSKSFWDQCFFAFDCDDHGYFGASLVYGNGTTVKITEDSMQRVYETDPKWLGVLSVGRRSTFKNNMTFDAEITYRGMLAGGGYQQKTGNAVNDSRSIELGYRGLGGSLAVGYLF